MRLRNIESADGKRWCLFGRLSLSPRTVCARLGAQGGFTIVEMLVTMIVIAVVSVAVLTVFSSISGVFNSQEVRIQNQDDARTAVNQIARFVRMATSSADNLTSRTDAIAVSLPQDLQFYCDVDGDGLAEKVRYYLQGSTLRMQTAEPSWVAGTDPHYEYPAYGTDGIVVQDAVRNGTSPVFTYYRYNSGVLVAFIPANDTDREAIVTVSISVTVNAQPALARGNVVLATDVQLRQRYEGGLQ